MQPAQLLAMAMWYHWLISTFVNYYGKKIDPQYPWNKRSNWYGFTKLVRVGRRVIYATGLEVECYGYLSTNASFAYSHFWQVATAFES